jgi:hypothetical protein
MNSQSFKLKYFISFTIKFLGKIDQQEKNLRSLIIN